MIANAGDHATRRLREVFEPSRRQTSFFILSLKNALVAAWV
jgi:hypothetical protein